MLVVCALLAPLGARAFDAPTIHVSDDAEFAAAVSALSEQGGTIVLRPHFYRGELVVSARSTRPLRIVGQPGARVERMLLDNTQRVSLSGITIEPATADAWIELARSHDIELDDVHVRADETHFSSTLYIPDSSFVTIRRSEFTHCGDRSPEFSNCVRLGSRSRNVTIESSWFHDCLGCDFVHGRAGSGLRVLRNRFERALPCTMGGRRCGHQDLIELFEGNHLRFEANTFGVYRTGGAQLYLTGPMDDVTIANNVVLAADPKVPGYRVRVGLIVGSRGRNGVPRHVAIVNNTILSGATRTDGYRGSIRMSAVYTWGVRRSERPVLANNVIGLLAVPGHVCREVRVSASNVVVRGSRCEHSDVVGSPHLDGRGRPTAASTLLIDRASRRYAPLVDITGRRRGSAPDIGAYEYGP